MISIKLSDGRIGTFEGLDPNGLPKETLATYGIKIQKRAIPSSCLSCCNRIRFDEAVPDSFCERLLKLPGVWSRILISGKMTCNFYNTPGTGIGNFYASGEWKVLRAKVLEQQSGACQCCGRTHREHGVVLHVDHIVPISKDWERRLDPSNLQVLCEDCNMGKGNRYTTDWRRIGKIIGKTLTETTAKPQAGKLVSVRIDPVDLERMKALFNENGITLAVGIKLCTFHTVQEIEAGELRISKSGLHFRR